MLILMTVTHLPTRFSGPFGQPLGLVSAAEGFVFLSAFMAGLIFSRRAMRDGMKAMGKAFLLRTLKLYACHVAMLVYLFTIIAALGITTDRQTIKNLISFYLHEPVTAFGSSLILDYNPPLLDTLPLYVVFMALGPWLLIAGIRLSWTPIIIGSGAIWLCAQFGLEKEIYQAVRNLAGLKVPFHETGAFDVLAWQVIWVTGLWMGAQTTANAVPKLPASVVTMALFMAATGFLTRHILGQAPFGESQTVAVLISKWHLGALRLLNFLALLALALRFGPALKAFIRCRFLEVLGAASLAVFCVHLALVLLALALVGDKKGATSLWVELALLAATIFAMYATARIFRPPPNTPPRLAISRRLTYVRPNNRSPELITGAV
jgi:hypothetical protein